MPNDIYFFKTGKFFECAKSENSDYLYRLWSIFYLSDKSLGARLLEEFEGELPSDQYGNAWKKRVALYKSLLLLTNGQIDEFSQRVGLIKNLELIGENDLYFIALAKHLKAVSKELEACDPKLGFKKVNRFTLIGDSHVLMNAGHWNLGHKDRISFLPGITMRALASANRNAAQYAIDNALAISDGSASIVFSVGEIDQRHIYTRITQYEKENYWGVLSESMRAGLRYISERKSCYQEFYIIGLPFYDSNIAASYGVSNVETLEGRINWYKDQLSLMAKDLDFTVFEPEIVKDSAGSKISDGFHFGLKYYQYIFQSILELDSSLDEQYVLSKN